jgi:hypothetical protein
MRGINLTGKCIPNTRLIVLKEASKEERRMDCRGNRVRSWWCLCGCGRRLLKPLTTNQLTSGDYKSCGCLRFGFYPMKEAKYRHCLICNVPFLVKRHNQRYCTKVCKNVANSTMRKDRRELYEIRAMSNINKLRGIVETCRD